MSDGTASALIPLVQETAPLRRKIAATLREAIAGGALRPGDHLVEKDLCRELNVSRTSLREALRGLQAEGLVTEMPRGLTVARLSERDTENIYLVRAMLEGLVAEQFAGRADDAHRAALQDVVARLEAAYGAQRADQTLGLKKEFYEILCRGADNLVVLDVLNRLNARITQLRSAALSDPSRGVASIAEIRNISAALLARDSQAARAAAIYHVHAAANWTRALRRC